MFEEIKNYLINCKRINRNIQSQYNNINAILSIIDYYRQCMLLDSIEIKENILNILNLCGVTIKITLESGSVIEIFNIFITQEQDKKYVNWYYYHISSNQYSGITEYIEFV